MHVQPNMQMHNPYQQQPQGYPPRRAAQPQSRPPGPSTRRPYPSHLTRFPQELLPRGRRGRGHSIGFYLYLGRHWILGLITLYVYAVSIAFVLSWITLVAIGWAMWVAAVTVGWACALPFRR